jgi:hypothetical protein
MGRVQSKAEGFGSWHLIRQEEFSEGMDIYIHGLTKSRLGTSQLSITLIIHKTHIQQKLLKLL